MVPEKPSNNAGSSAAETVEGRGLGKSNAAQQNAHRTQSRESAHSALDRVRQAAKKDRGAKFTALMHHLTIDRLRASFLELKKEAAPGIDGVTWEQYQVALEENLRGLHQRLHTGAYRAKPTRRTYIPKADGRLRPLGVASLEDKLVQRAVVEVLNAIYEEDFLGFSYGFRPGRSQHNALDALAAGLQWKKVNWVLDADIRGFFDAIDHGWLMKFIEHRVADPRVLRLIQKWLKAGVMEDGKRVDVQAGTPQGATVSPLLANIYLHYVFDLWTQQWRNRHTSGDVIVVRYADDFIVGFQHRRDAERFQRELRERLQKFSLELHPEKTRLIEFGRYAADRREEHGKSKPETFDFLGFSHACGKSGDKKRFVLLRLTIRKRLRAKLLDVKYELKRRHNDSIREQGTWLREVVRGYFGYHAVPTNIRALRAFRREAVRTWRRALIRRGQKGRMPWYRMKKFIERYIPKAKIQHPWPDARFDVRTRAKSRMR
jgi:group II intron reverse transcriptase/maturase